MPNCRARQIGRLGVKRKNYKKNLSVKFSKFGQFEGQRYRFIKYKSTLTVLYSAISMYMAQALDSWVEELKWSHDWLENEKNVSARSAKSFIMVRDKKSGERLREKLTFYKQRASTSASALLEKVVIFKNFIWKWSPD